MFAAGSSAISAQGKSDLTACAAKAKGTADCLVVGLATGRVTAPDGLGVATDAGTGSNANARRVTVDLVVDKGVQVGKQ